MSDLTTEKIEEKKIKITYTNGHVKVVAILPHKDTGLYSYVNLTEGHICQCSFASAEEALKDLDNYPNIEKWEFINEWSEDENTSDDLISKKVFIEKLKSYCNRTFLGEFTAQSEISIGELSTIIKDIPIAYDVNAVREEIHEVFREELGDIFDKDTVVIDAKIDWILKINKKIGEIVRNGGGK